MSLKTDGSIFIFSSPSGAGKTTLVDLFSKKENFTISISHTTRNPRSNEVEGKDYYFVSQEKFETMIKQNEFLEFARVFNNLYGTTKIFLDSHNLKSLAELPRLPESQEMSSEIVSDQMNLESLNEEDSKKVEETDSIH